MENNGYISEDVIIRYLRMKGIEANCCSSCHYEMEEGFNDGTEIFFSKNRYTVTCCAIVSLLYDAGIEYSY